MNDIDTNLRRDYGVHQTNGMDPEDLKAMRSAIAGVVYWTCPGLRITRLRLLSDVGYPEWDVSYCWGTAPAREVYGDKIPTGISPSDRVSVRVQLPFGRLSKRRMLSEIIDAAKKDNVFAKQIGILDKGNWSTLV